MVQSKNESHVDSLLLRKDFCRECLIRKAYGDLGKWSRKLWNVFCSSECCSVHERPIMATVQKVTWKWPVVSEESAPMWPFNFIHLAVACTLLLDQPGCTAAVLHTCRRFTRKEIASVWIKCACELVRTEFETSNEMNTGFYSMVFNFARNVF